MRRQRIIITTAVCIMLISIGLIGYAAYKITDSNASIEENIALWEENKSEAARIESVPTVVETTMAESANETKPTQKKPQYKLMGKLVFESTGEAIPVISGTDASRLLQGAGYYTASAQPGEPGNCLIFGHRDSVFKNLGKLKPEEYITLETEKGTYKYKILETVIVDEIHENILQKSDKSTLTLVTCYPFNYLGTAPQRYLVKAQLQ